jgi:hypothetical protein
MVMIQRPKDLDTAFVLAQMWEEIVEASRTWEYQKYDSSTSNKTPSRGPFPLPPPPKNVPGKPADTKAIEHLTDCLSSVYAFRKAQGLCYKCGLSYFRVINVRIQFNFTW